MKLISCQSQGALIAHLYGFQNGYYCLVISTVSLIFGSMTMDVYRGRGIASGMNKIQKVFKDFEPED